MKTQVKKALATLGGNAPDQINSAFVSAVVAVNKAKSKGVIHKNNAARKVSRLAKKVHKVLAAKS